MSFDKRWSLPEALRFLLELWGGRGNKEWDAGLRKFYWASFVVVICSAALLWFRFH